MSLWNEDWYIQYRAILQEHAMSPEQVVQQYRAKLEQAVERDAFLQQKTPEAIVQMFIQTDPTGGKLVQWLAIRYIRGNFRAEDLNRLGATLRGFVQHKNRLKQKDINQYATVQDLEDAIAPLEQQAPELSGKQQARQMKQEGAEKVYEDPEMTVLLLKTKEAACFYGKGTQWCTAADKDNMFDQYNKSGSLYVLLMRDGRKFQYHPKQKQFMDERDRPIDSEIFVKYPSIAKWMLDPDARDAPMKFLMFTLNYTHKRYPPEQEEIILRDPDVALVYYNQYIVDSKKLKQSVGKKFENVFALKSSAAYWYANLHLNGRFPEGENVIIQDPLFAALYAEEILGKRWVEAEPVIKTNSTAALRYIFMVLKRRWKEAEPALMKEPNEFLEYLLFLKKDGVSIPKDLIEPGKKIFVDNAVWAARFAIYIMEKRFPEAELAIHGHDNLQYVYLKKFPEAKDDFLKFTNEALHRLMRGE